MSLTNDPNYQGYYVDIAVLEHDLSTIISEPKMHKIELSPVSLSYASFQALFYKDGQRFNPSKTAFNNVFAQPLIGNNFRTILKSPFQSENPLLYNKFNLLKSLISAHEEDLNIPASCWDMTNLMYFSTIISNIKSLNDMAGNCGNNIKCSITLDEFFNNLEAQGLLMDPLSGLPLEPSGNSGVIYTGLVTANITAIFHSTTPDVKDTQIKWPFLINFNSFKVGDSTGNNSIWPKYYWMENADGSITTTPRSDGALKQSTVYDIAGTPAFNTNSTVGFPRAAFNLNGVQYPSYDRYKAYLYSSIK